MYLPLSLQYLHFAMRRALLMLLLCNILSHEGICMTAEGMRSMGIHLEEGSPKNWQELQRDSFESLRSNAISLGMVEGGVWIHLPLEEIPEGYALELLSPNLDSLKVYHVRGDSLLAEYLCGEAFPFRMRPVPSPQFVFPLRPQEAGSEVFIRIASTRPIYAPIRVKQLEGIQRSQHRKDIFFGMYAGIVLVMFFYNLFVWISVRDRNYLNYIMAIFFVGLTQLVLNGYGNEYFWPENPYLGLLSVPMVGVLSGVGSLVFALHFLRTKEYSPKLHKIISAAVVLYAIAAAMALAGFLAESYQLVNLCALASLLLLYAAFRSYRNGYRPALYFIFAWSFFLVGVTIYSLSGFGVLPYSTGSQLAMPIGSAIEVILLSFAIADKFKRYREDALDQLVTIHKMKVKANAELEQKVQERTEEIASQKALLETQQEEILSSIRYAEHLQNALLPKQSDMQKCFPESFVFLRARNIVSGDFYWFGEVPEDCHWQEGRKLKVFALVDCTGHGVPGALMSVLGKTALDKSLSAPEVKCTASALKYINKEIIEALTQDKGAAQALSDGMDMVLCAFDTESRKLHFAGAKNNLYLLRDGQVHIVKGDRYSIGEHSEEGERSFTEHTLLLQPGDMLYAFTDGFPDQFGGCCNKKLKTKTLLGMLRDLADKSICEQERLIAQIFDQWKGEQEQVDDVCLMGLRVR